jgi:hypothetical protein
VDTPNVTASFRMYRSYRVQLLAMFTIFVAFGIGLAVTEAAGARHMPPVWFVLLWLAALAWNGYWFLFRLCYRLELADGVVHWFTPLRSGWVSVAEVRGARPAFNLSSRWFNFVEVIDLANHRPLLVMVINAPQFGRSRVDDRHDLAWFLYQLEKLTPDAPMRLE